MFTFDLPPEQCFRGRFSLITSFAGKVEKIFAHGIEEIAWLPFDNKLASLSAENFIRELLVEQLAARHIVCGFNFRFGRDRAGDSAYLQKMGARHGYEVTEVGPVQGCAGEVISSTAVRSFIAKGELGQAARYLGYFPAYLGKVVRGQGRGRLLGFPTANLEIEPKLLLPAEGVYLTWCILAGQLGVPAVASIGKNPTFAGKIQTIEAYILDFSGDLYHQTLEIQFLHRLRGIYKYDSAPQLQQRIKEDIIAARQLLSRFHLQDGRIVLR